MENLTLRPTVEFLSKEENVGLVVISPCHRGYGTTLGNALRRILLSSLPGSAVQHFKISGVQHEFSAVPGIKEDLVEIMLQLKQLAVIVHSNEPVTLNLSAKVPGPVTAGDISANADVEIVNKKMLICTLTGDKEINMEITVGRGQGYEAVEEKDRQNHDLGTIVVDSIYTPVKDVGYNVEFTRVGDITNYEKLSISIETNGTITPQEAMRQASQILMDHFNVILEAASADLPTVKHSGQNTSQKDVAKNDSGEDIASAGGEEAGSNEGKGEEAAKEEVKTPKKRGRKPKKTETDNPAS